MGLHHRPQEVRGPLLFGRLPIRHSTKARAYAFDEDGVAGQRWPVLRTEKVQRHLYVVLRQRVERRVRKFTRNGGRSMWMFVKYSDASILLNSDFI